jgi:hypothetical protein
MKSEVHVLCLEVLHSSKYFQCSSLITDCTRRRKFEGMSHMSGSAVGFDQSNL